MAIEKLGVQSERFSEGKRVNSIIVVVEVSGTLRWLRVLFFNLPQQITIMHLTALANASHSGPHFSVRDGAS